MVYDVHRTCAGMPAVVLGTNHVTTTDVMVDIHSKCVV